MNLKEIDRKLEQLIRYSEILGRHQSQRQNIEHIINDIYTLKQELLELIKENSQPKN